MTSRVYGNRHCVLAYANRVRSTYRTRDRAAPDDAADAAPPRRTLTKRLGRVSSTASISFGNYILYYTGYGLTWTTAPRLSPSASSSTATRLVEPSDLSAPLWRYCQGCRGMSSGIGFVTGRPRFGFGSSCFMIPPFFFASVIYPFRVTMLKERCHEVTLDRVLRTALQQHSNTNSGE